MATRLFALAETLGIGSEELIAEAVAIGLTGLSSSLNMVFDDQERVLRDHLGSIGRLSEESGSRDILLAPPVEEDEPTTSRTQGEIPQLAKPGVDIGRGRLESPVSMSDSFFVELLSDVEHARSLVNNEPTQFHRRIYVQALFSAVEAFVSTVEQWLIRQQGKMCVSNQQKHLIKSANAIQNKYLDHLSYLNLVLVAYASFRKKRPTFFDADGWKSYQNARRTRNRLAHPDKHSGVTVDDVELAEVIEAEQWILNAWAILGDDSAAQSE